MAYTTTAAISPLGGTLAINTGTVSTPTYVTIAEIKDITWGERVNRTADATNLSSTAEEFIATLPSSGNMKVVCNRIDNDPGQLAIEAAWRARTTKLYQLTYPKTATQTTNGDVYIFSAIVEAATPAQQFKPSDVINYEFTLKISGLDAYTAGT